MSAAAKRQIARHPESWEVNLDDEDMVIPNRQPGNAPPSDDVGRGEHVGEHVKSLAETLSALADTTLNSKVSMGALTQLAFAACTADVTKWDELADLSEETKTVV